MASSIAEVIARLVDRFTLTANDEVVPIYPDGAAGIVDGNFDFWDTGTSFTLSGGATNVAQYTASMWFAYVWTNGVATISQLPRTLGSEPSYVTRPSKYKLRWAQTTAQTGTGALAHRLEGVSQYSGQSVTVSASLQAAAAGNWIVGVGFVQKFGTGGTPSANASVFKAVTWNIGTTEQKFSVRLDVPSISGKTLGTNGDDYIELQFQTAQGVTYTVDFSQVQLDVCSPSASGDTTGNGGAPLPFRYRGISVEKARVAWYCRLMSWAAGQNIMNAGMVNATSIYGWSSFGGRMRQPPAFSIISGSIFSSSAASGWSGGTVSVSATNDQFWQISSGGSGGTTGSFGWFYASSSGVAIFADARL